MKALFFCKERPGYKEAIEYTKQYTRDLRVYISKPGENFPQEALDLKPDLTISYISAWIIPEILLKNTKKWALNFHPGPPEYPGTGCVNFAIYNEEKEYGVTAHIMEAEVDRGKIVQVKRYAVKPEDSVADVIKTSYEVLLDVYKSTIKHIFEKHSLPECNETWKRKPYTRRELNALCEIQPNMSEDEIKRRIRATYYPPYPGAYVMLKGKKFIYQE